MDRLKHLSNIKIALLYSALGVVVFGFFAYLEWPGIYNDAFQEDLAKLFDPGFNYWRSYLYSLYMHLGKLFNYSIGGYLVLQITSCICLLVLSAVPLHRYAPKTTFLFMGLLVLWPINAMFSVLLIRDILAGWLNIFAMVEFYFLLLGKRKPYTFLFVSAALAVLRPENIVMSIVGIGILLWRARSDRRALVNLSTWQLAMFLFMFVILPLLVGAELKRIKPFATGEEKTGYEAVSLLGPLQEKLLTMSAEELNSINWDALEAVRSKDQWLEPDNDPVFSHLAPKKSNTTKDGWAAFNKEAYKIIMSDPLLLLKNRGIMFWHAAGFGSHTYYLHGVNAPSQFTHQLIRLPNYIFASLLLPILLTIYAFEQWRRVPVTGLALIFNWSRLIPVFLYEPAPHFSYLYNLFLGAFFILPMMMAEKKLKAASTRPLNP